MGSDKSTSTPTIMVNTLLFNSLLDLEINTDNVTGSMRLTTFVGIRVVISTSSAAIQSTIDPSPYLSMWGHSQRPEALQASRVSGAVFLPTILITSNQRMEYNGGRWILTRKSRRFVTSFGVPWIPDVTCTRTLLTFTRGHQCVTVSRDETRTQEVQFPISVEKIQNWTQ
jgi:hypothetical protein